MASLQSTKVTGSLLISGSDPGAELTVIGSGSSVMIVSGSTGTLLNVLDNPGGGVLSVVSSSIYLFNVDSGSATANVRISASAGITGSLFGTASWANNVISASYALSASVATTASYALSASVATTASYALSASVATTASYIIPVYQSYYENNVLVGSSHNSGVGGSSMQLQPFVLPYNISVSYVRIPVSQQITSNTIGSSANATLTLNISQTLYANFYSLGTGANSRSLQYVGQASATSLYQILLSQGATSSNISVYHNFTYLVEGGTAAFATSYATTQTNIPVSTTHLTAFTGFRFLDIPFVSSLSAGAYWIGLQRSSATATTGGGNNFSGITIGHSHLIATQTNINSMNIMGGNTTVFSVPLAQGLGLWSTNSNGATASSIALSQISTQASHPKFPFQLIRQA